MRETRVARIESEILEVISYVITHELKDPGIAPMTSVTEVRVSRDVSYADIYVSAYGNDTDVKNTMDALERSKGYIRSAIGREVKLRLTPEVRIHLDESIANGVRMNKVIMDTIRADEERKHADGNESSD